MNMHTVPSRTTERERERLTFARRQVRHYTRMALQAEQDSRDYPHWPEPPHDAAKAWTDVAKWQADVETLEEPLFRRLADLAAENTRLRDQLRHAERAVSYQQAAE